MADPLMLYPELAQQPIDHLTVGTSGLRRAGGYVQSDFLPELSGSSGVKTFREMGTNDPVCAAMLYALGSLVRKVNWHVDPSDDNDAEAAKLAEWVSDVLFKQKLAWNAVIDEVVSMFMFGYAPMEIIWFLDEETGRYVPERLALRGHESLSRWQFDDTTGQLQGMWQLDVYSPRRGEVYIPISKLALFRTTNELDNPEGKSLLRSSYVPWRRKKAIEEAEGRMALRSAGLVVLRIPGRLFSSQADDTTKQQYTEWTNIVRMLGEDRTGGVMLPSDVNPDTKTPLYDLQYLTADKQRSTDMGPMIERIDKRMAGAILADFLFLGQQSVGSFALSSDKTALFSDALGAQLGRIAEVMNKQVIQRMFAINALPLDKMPRMGHDDIETPDLTELAGYVSTLSASGMALFPDEKLEDYLRTAGGLPKGSGTAEALAVPPPDPFELAQATADAKASTMPEKPPAKEKKPGGGKVKKLLDRLVNRPEPMTVIPPPPDPTIGQALGVMAGAFERLSKQAPPPAPIVNVTVPPPAPGDHVVIRDEAGRLAGTKFIPLGS